jgi:uncharacterized membrane-anchored protein
MTTRCLVPCAAAAILLLLAPGTVRGQQAEKPQQPAPLAIDWIHGPATAELGGNVAKIEVPKGFIFTGPEGTRKLMERMGNRPSAEELGLLAPASQEKDWFLLFSFHEVGYVKDEDKDKIDAKALLQSIREGTEEGNKWRAQKGIAPLHVVGWSDEPHYDPQSHNLVWAIEARVGGDRRVVNYDVRLLGRKGYMSVTLVTDPPALAAEKPEVEGLLRGFSYQQGSRYAEFMKGDKVAEFGLAALVAGGAGAAAAKLGLFAKLGKVLARFAKLIAVGAAALFAAIRKLLGLKPKKQDPSQAPPAQA